MKMDARMKHLLDRRAAPYLFEGGFALTLETVLVAFLLLFFYKMDLIRYGVIISVLFFLVDFFLNCRIACLCVVDKLHREYFMVSGTVLDIDSDASFTLRSGSILSSRYVSAKDLQKVKLVFEDSDGKKQVVRLVMSCRHSCEAADLIRSPHIAEIRFTACRFSKLLLKCDVEYRDGIGRREKKALEDCVRHLNFVEAV